MSAAPKDLLAQSKPWRADAKWPIIAAEAALLIVLGLYMAFNTGSAKETILQIIGLVFLTVSLQVAVSSFRSVENGLGVFDSFRAGIGVTVGVIAVSLWWADAVPNQAVRQILGWGLVAYSVLQLVGMVVVRGRENLRPMALLVSALTLVLGILLLTSNDAAAEGRVAFLGVIFIIFGVLLGGLAYLIRGRDAVAPAN